LIQSPEADRRSDSGNASVEFLLVSILVVALALGVIQLAFALHVRNVLISSAHEGAHYAALADRTPSEGAQRTESLVSSALGGVNASVSAQPDNIGGAPAVAVTVVARVPLIGWWGVGNQAITAHALTEVPRG
jgi:Flp pilus assembly protein TadG